MKTNSQVFTSSLPAYMLDYLNDISKKSGIHKNKIIEKAILLFMEQRKRAEMVDSFKRAAQDKDIKEISEEGYEDFLTLIEK